MTRIIRPNTARRANSLLELTVVVSILGVLAAMALPRVNSAVESGDRSSCHLHRAEVELQARLWLRTQGGLPAADLSDIGSDINYFPEGLPTCPVDGSAYTIDASTGDVIGHDH